MDARDRRQPPAQPVPALRSQQWLALVNGFIHQLRNPLFGISAQIDNYAETAPDDAAKRELVNAVRAELERMELLVRDVHEYAAPAPLELRLSDPSEAVRNAARPLAALAQSLGVALEIECREPLPRLVCDRARLGQALQLLGEHALRRSPAGSAVKMTIRRARAAIAGHITQVGEHPPAGLRRLLLPFGERRPGESGLGLPIAESIIARHGGSLKVAPLGQGGGLRLLLPLKPRGGERRRRR